MQQNLMKAISNPSPHRCNSAQKACNNILRSAGNEEAQPLNKDQEMQMQPAEEDKGNLKIVIQGNVARIVLKNALESIPDSLDFRLKLLDTIEESSLPGTDALISDILTDLEVKPWIWALVSLTLIIIDHQQDRPQLLS